MEKLIIKNSFEDFDDFVESTKWSLEFEQLSSGKFHAEYISFMDRDLQIGKVVYNVALLQNGSTPDGYTFAIHHPNSAPIKWRYLDFPGNGIIVFPENKEHQGVSQKNHQPFTITIKENFLSAIAEEIGLPDPSKFVAKGEIHLCDPSAIHHIQTFLGSLLFVMESACTEFAKALMNYDTKWKIARMILLALSDSKVVKPQKRQFHQRQKLFDRVMDCVNKDLSTTISIPELCRMSGVTERTLRNIFYEQVSLSPNRFIKCHRLNNVRRALKRLDSAQVVVSDVANSKGFWHMGQFALDYRKLFNELPSETFKKDNTS